MPTRVFLLRHAESADPTVFHGAESDVGLSAKGLRQAELIAPVLAAYRPDVVASSAMRRARLTAEPIARACGRPLVLVPELHERRVGTLSGTLTSDPTSPWHETSRRWAAGETWFAHDGAESFDDLRARLLPAWERLVSDHAGQTLVVVAHGVVCKVLLVSLLAGHTVGDWARLGSIRNAAITELVQAGEGWQAVRLNDWPAELAALDEV